MNRKVLQPQPERARWQRKICGALLVASFFTVAIFSARAAALQTGNSRLEAVEVTGSS